MSSSMAFLQYALPPLMSGNFTVTVQQTVSVLGQGDTFETQQQFLVAGDRYTLGPTDVSSVFPPAGNQGEFSNVLPHVVLTQPTLPWQRSPLPDPPPPQAGAPVPTWLGVFLFDENDPPPTPTSATIGDLAAAGTTFFPPRVAEDGEQSTDPVTVIDVPVATFTAIAPSLADLQWTAHVRTVDPAAKSTGATPPGLEYAVVFGNRLPVAGNTATAHLVSLEGYGPYLPADDGTASGAIPGDVTLVRLVTLRSWVFTALDLQQTFAGTLLQVSMDPPGLQLPYDGAAATGNAAADGAVQNAFGMGYTALDHGLRDGSRTVSWYRGPLLPLGTAVTAAPPWADADSLVRYDPTNGMLDTSYAAAWQLGRLLALHDAAFAAALYRWKLGETQTQVAAIEQGLIDAELPPITQAGDDTASDGGDGGDGGDGATAANPRHTRMASVIRHLVGPAAARLTTLGTGE